MAIAGCDAGDGEGEGFGFSFALGAMAAIHCAVRFHSFCDGFASFFLAISPFNGRRDSVGLPKFYTYWAVLTQLIDLIAAQC